MSDPEALYSLVAGEGDGAMLGLAAGDTAGGAWELGYSAFTEQATVISYLLIEGGELDFAAVVRRVRELDGSQEEDPVYRSESSDFRGWLDRVAAGSPAPGKGPSLDAGPRSVPVGVTHRRNPDRLQKDVLGLGLLFHSDALTVLGGAVVAAAVAASCFGQSGRDLIAGVAEAVEPVAEALGGQSGVTGVDRLETATTDLRSLTDLVGIADGQAAFVAVGGDESRRPWDLIRSGLLLAAPLAERSHAPIEQAARIGGSALGSAVGGIVGARVGIRAWPWAFANDTWFAEIGRRLVRGPAEVTDLPIPYAVEHHLIEGERRGFV